MKNFLTEFKNFAIKGNLIDMAVAVVIGTAFNKVVSALVKKVIMPPLSLMTEGSTLTKRKYVLREASEGVDEVAIGYGELLEVFIDFLIIAFTVFVVIKFINRFKQKSDDPENETVETPKNIELLSKIEDLLKEQNELLKKDS
ncbi:MAG: large-conductance mechanosensitive channel protein MscL [Gilvibacter sp.]